METDIINFLQKEYNAKAILLHGSRARGNPHKQSDWDLLVLTDEIIRRDGGAKLNNEDLDIKVVKLPILDMDKFISGYPQTLQCIKVFLDSDDGIATRILELAKSKYEKGPGTTEERKNYTRHHFDRMLTRLVDFKDNPQVFTYHLSSFYIKSIRYWFEYQNRWSQPICEALKIIEKEDVAFMNGLYTISDQTSTAGEKIAAAERMIQSVLNNAS